MAHIILPGDSINLEPNINVTIGPGIYKVSKCQSIIPVNAGIFHVQVNRKQTNQVVYLDLETKRYIPQANDLVIGVVTGTIGENYKVILQGFSTPVMLPMMAFPHATKKNRPNLNEGDAVYARVVSLIPELETELLCVDSKTGKDGGFGLLDTTGFIFDIKQSFARELLFNAQSVYLEKLVTRCQFEIAVGINGKVWIKCGDSFNIKDQAVNSEVDMIQSQGSVTVPELSEKVLNTTLAASKFLLRCQNLNLEDLDDLLAQYFRGI